MMDSPQGVSGQAVAEHSSQSSKECETADLLQPVLSQLLKFLARADNELKEHLQYDPASPNVSCLVPVGSLDPEILYPKLQASLNLPHTGVGAQGLVQTVQAILDNSVNPSAPGFLDKLYAAPLPPGIAAELILACLNTNLHVYQVSPVLTLIEKHVSRNLAKLFGLNGPRAGGISVQGGSASNLTSIVVARNSLFPETKVHGNAAVNNGKLMMFTSAHGHYSIEKAAQALGFGSQNVVPVPVDAEGRMKTVELNRLIVESKQRGETPFYINATAGTTVLGSFDLFDDIARVAQEHRCWFHIDGSWGGGFVFSNRDDIKANLKGMERADSIAINPHKMLGVPVTCSFLLTRDLRLFEAAMTLRAGYLFHDVEEDEDKAAVSASTSNDETHESKDVTRTQSASDGLQSSLYDMKDEDSQWSAPNDLADLTLQCGRRGDSLKFFLSWQYYGTGGYSTKVDDAYDLAHKFNDLVEQNEHLTGVLDKGIKPQCLQVCFYYTPCGRFPFGTMSSEGDFAITKSMRNATSSAEDARKLTGKYNTIVTARITKALIARGFMIDFAPALEGQEDRGSFFRVVLNISTLDATVKRLVHDLVEVGQVVIHDLRSKYQPSTTLSPLSRTGR